MVNPGRFQGLRKQFLDDQQELYAAAVEDNHIADAVADIQRRYFKRFPITLSHTQEPTAEFLAAVDDDAPDSDLIPPQQGTSSDEEYARDCHVYELRVAELTMRKAQIKRRLHYQYTKAQGKKATFEMGTTDPMAVLMTKLTGGTVQKPRQKTAYNLWGPANRTVIDPIFLERVRAGNIPAKQHAALRSALYKEFFEELPEEERKEWVKKAEDEHKEALLKVNIALKAGAPMTPADRQRVIEGLTKFAQPIVDLISEHTGWAVSILAGGPEPADGGRLNMTSVHSGNTSGMIKMNFGWSERVAYCDIIVPVYGKFLRKCYTRQECHEWALPEKHGFAGLAEVCAQDSTDLFTFDNGTCKEGDTYVQVAAPRHKSSTASATVSSSRSTADASSTAVKATPKPPVIKFGPLKAMKNHTAGVKSSNNSNLADNRSQANISNNVTPAAVFNNTNGNKEVLSWGPTPLTSRAATPTLADTIIVPSAPNAPNAAPVPRIADGHPASVELAPALHASVVSPDSESGASSTSIDNASMSDIGHTASVARTPEPSVPHAPSVANNDILNPVAITSLSAPNIAISAPAIPTTSRTVSTAIIAPRSVSATEPCTASSENIAIQARTAPIEIIVTPSNASVDDVIPHALSPTALGVASIEDITDAAPARTTVTPPAAPNEDSIIKDAIPHAAPPIRCTAFVELPTRQTQMTRPVASPGPLTSGSIAVPSMQQLTAAEAEKKARTSKCKGGPAGAVSDQKKRKTSSHGISSASTSSDRMDVDNPSYPDWVTKALALLRSAQLGSDWDSLVRKWLMFEANSGYQGSAKLGTGSRPQIIKDWIKRARSPDYFPEIKDVSAFGVSITAWWRGLQPDWRVDDVGGANSPLRREGGSWEDIRCPGVNGLLSVMAGLLFWGRNAQGARPWLDVVDDISHVLDQLLL